MNKQSKKYINYYRFFFLILLFVFYNNSMYAQSPEPWVDSNSADFVPIDGGLSLLVVAGVGYGIKKSKDFKRKKSK